jgi:hypothetical protein
VLVSASIISVACLLSVHFLLVCVLCIVRVPDLSGLGLVYLTFDAVVSLAFNAMIISFLEFIVYRVVAVICLCLEKRRSATDDVLIAYYTKASKDIDAEARDREIILKSNLEVYAKMLECLQMLIDERSAKASVDGVVTEKSDAGVSEDEIAVSDEKSYPKDSSSSNASSIRSSALTE